MLNHALFFHNLSRQIFCEIFVKIENTEYLSNQLTYANFDLAMMFPIKNWTFEQILVFLISEMSLACPTTTVKGFCLKKFQHNSCLFSIFLHPPNLNYHIFFQFVEPLVKERHVKIVLVA